MNIHRHTLYNCAGHVLSLVVLLATVPFYLDLIGLERYGVLSIMWLVQGYFGVFDLGIGQAVAQRVAAFSKQRETQVGPLLWAGLWVSMPMALLGGAILYYAIGGVLEVWVSIDPHIRTEVGTALPWVALGLAPMILGTTLRGALLGSERFLAFNAVDVAGRLVVQMLPLLAAILWGPDLGNVARAACAARLLGLVFWVVASAKALPGNLSPRWSPILTRRLLRYGTWITVGVLVAPLLSGLERVFISNARGASAVSYYAVPFSLVAPIALLASSLSTALFPRFSALHFRETDALAKRAVKAVTVLITPVMVLMAFTIGPFLGIWIDAPFAQKGARVAQILIVGFWSNGLAKVFHTKLQAEGRPGVVARLHLGELIPYLLLLALLTKMWGVHGAAIAWTLRTVADTILLGVKNQLGSQLFWTLSVPLALVSAACLLAHATRSNLVAQLAIGLSLTGISVAWSWHNGLGTHMRTLVSRLRNH